MKTKTTFIAVLAAATMTAGVGTAVIFNNFASPVKADTPVSIGTLAQLKTYFDGAGTNCGNSATLTADIDLDGAYVSGMAGEFTATFNGNGHKLYNGAVGANKSLFNIIGTAGVVKNLTYDVTITGAVIRPLSYQNNGTIQDCTAVLRTGAASVNNVAAYAYLAGSGTYTNLYTDWVVNHTGADWLCSVYRDQSSTNITGSYYTMNGSVASSTNFQANSMTKSIAVNYLNPTSASLSATIGGSAAQVVEAFGTDNTSVTAVSADTGVASVSEISVSGYTVTGVAAGSTNVTFTVVSTTGTYSFVTPVTVVASAPVSAVALDKSSASVYESKTVALTATLTGTEYSSISWASDATAYATVSGSGVNATVTGVAAGSANITVTVVSTSGTYSASCAVTVNPRVIVPVYLLESKKTEAKTAYWDQAWVSPYGELTTGLVKMNAVTVNGNQVYFRFANPGNKSTVDQFKLWEYDLDVTGKAMTYTNSWVQFSSGVGLWGAGFQITSAAGNVAILGYSGSASPTAFGYTVAELKEALTYAGTTVYSGSWRVSNSICYLVDGAHETARLAAVNGYKALSTNGKTVAAKLDDSTTAYTATLLDTLTLLNSGSAPSYAVSSLSDYGNYIPWIIVSVASMIAVGGFFFIRNKRKVQD